MTNKVQPWFYGLLSALTLFVSATLWAASVPVTWFGTPPAGGGGEAPPEGFTNQFSINLKSPSSQRLRLSHANFGTYDSNVIYVSAWWYRTNNSASATMRMMSDYGATGNRSWTLGIRNDSPEVVVYPDGTNGTYTIWGDNSYDVINAWHHELVVINTTNTVSTNRFLWYHDGVRDGAFSDGTYPTGGLLVTTADIEIGAANASSFFNGYLDEVAFGSGYAPSPTNFITGTPGVPRDLAYLTNYGLKAWVRFEVNPTNDTILPTAWTSVNGPTNATLHP